MRRTKTAIALILTLAAAVALTVALTALPQRLVFRGGESYTFFVGDTSKNCREVTVDEREAAITRLSLNDVCGECVTYSTLNLQEFLDEVGGEIIFREELPDSVNYYCKAPLPYSVELYGEEINLHVCVRADGVKVGSPIIFGGY